VKLLPEIPLYKIFATQMKVAVCNALSHGQLRVALFRLKVWMNRGLKRPFSEWDDLPTLSGRWDLVCSYSDGFAAEVVVRKTNSIKKALWVHEDYERAPRSKNTLDAFRKARIAVGVSQDAVTHLRNVLAPTDNIKMYVIHNIVDPDAVKRRAKECTISLSDKKVQLVSVGRVSYEKGYDRIPTILSALKDQCVDAEWTVVGPGLESVRMAVEVDAERLGVKDRIHFVGEQSNPFPFLDASDVFVQLSRNEGWCMAISEALCLGKPVVANDLPVFREQIFNGENGYLVGGDDADFAKAIQMACTDKHLQGWAECNLEKLPFTPDSVLSEFERMISET